MMKATKEATKTNVDTTPRKVYVRRGITHICFAGSHFAPKDGETAINEKLPVTKVKPITSMLLEVTQCVDTNRPAIVELWDQVTVPRRHKTNTVNGFLKASNAWFTGWTY